MINKPTHYPPQHLTAEVNKSDNKSRINWLDTSRGLAFLMVIYSHLEYCNDSIMRYFSPVFLTTFFFVSGYLFKERCSFSKVFEQRTRTLLLPFLSLGVIMILMSQVLTFNEKVPFVEELKGLLFQNGKNELLWFVAALYVYSLIFYWIERFAVTPERLLFFSVILFIANEVVVWMGIPRIPWHINSFGFACFYMGLGKYYKEKQMIIDKYVDNKRFVAVMFVIYILLISLFDLHISFYGSKFIIEALSVTLSGLVVMIYISKHINQKNRLMLFVGANSLFYFAFHGKCFSLLQTICHKLVTEDILSIYGTKDIIAFSIVILDALILILPAMFVNRYCPFILGKGFKLWNAK